MRTSKRKTILGNLKATNKQRSLWHDEKIKISQISRDGLMIEEFDEGLPDVVLRGKGKVVLFKESSRGSDRILALSVLTSGPHKVDVLRPVDDTTMLVPGERTKTRCSGTPGMALENVRKPGVFTLRLDAFQLNVFDIIDIVKSSV